jgi:hypothetical protein
MEVISLSSTNYIGLTSNYTLDSTINVNQQLYYTEDGIMLPFTDAYKKLGDNTINNFSNLFLTNKLPLSTAITINNLDPLTDEGFSTYLAADALRGITGASRFLVVQEPPVQINTAFCSMSGTFNLIDDRYMFDIQFITDKLCKIYHENDNVKRYLTVDYSGALRFAKDANLDYLEDANPQSFYYVYDKDSDYIIFLKNVNDIAKYVYYDAGQNNIALTDPLTSADLPYSTRAIFKCTPRADNSNDTKLLDPWVSYKRDFHTNQQNINGVRSYPTIPGNLLVNSEYYKITGTELPINILSLKNTATPENAHTRGNPHQRQRSDMFFETDVEMRDYKKLYTGSNQKYGNDNITIGYESYTTDIILKKDSITYFHMPQNTYPYTQININQSGVTEAGAIAGDHPLKSDKVFKKLTSYKYTSPYGQARDEATGNFLCSWLSGNFDVNTRPVWMDRYYNPSKITYFSALSTNPIQAINYTTVSDCLFAEIDDLLGKVDVFDKPSDLTFEPGVYYAYHHYGPSDVLKYIQSLDVFKVQTDIFKYYTTEGVPVFENNTIPEEYSFDGTKYAVSETLSSIQTLGEFTMSFWAKTDDWSQPFGDQIIGNYVNDGVGIFNQNLTTPTLYVNTITGAYILNTDLKLIKTLTYDNLVSALVKLDNITDYYVIFDNGDVKKYNAVDAEIRSVNSNTLTKYISHDYNESTIYALCTGIAPNERTVIKIDLPSVAISDIKNTLFNQPLLTLRCAVDITDPGWIVPGTSITQRFNRGNTIDYYDGKVFITPGQFTRRVDDTIYYLKDSKTIVRWDDITRFSTLPVVTAFRTNSQIEDFNIDFDNNLWVLTNDNSFYKFTLDRKFVLSGTTTDPNFKNFKIGFIADFFNGKYTKQVLITQKGSIPLPPNPWRSYTYDIINNNEDTFITGNFETIESNIYSTISSTGYLFNIYTTEGQLVANTSVLATTGISVDPTNSDFLRKYIAVKYPKNNLNIKTTLTNIYNYDDLQTIDIKYSLSSLDPGYHHFAVRVDSYQGYVSFFIDGQKVEMVSFPPRKYQFNDFTNRPFLIGTSNFVNSIPLFKYLKKNASLAAGLTIKDFRLYNRALKETDVIMLARENNDIHDIRFTVPCGRRNYLEEIERYFKASYPTTKSTAYNIIVKNTGITDESLREAIEKRIIEQLQITAPAYSKLNKIKWIN